MTSTRTRFLLRFSAILLVLSARLHAADAPLRFDAQPTGSEMRIDGISVVKDWFCKSLIIAGSFEVEPAWQKDLTLQSVSCLGPGRTPPALRAAVLARTLKSSGGQPMDAILLAALKARQFPTIEYKLTEMALAETPPPSGTPVKFDTKGELTVAGVTNLVSFPVTMERVGRDQLTFIGRATLKMTDFGITPPAPKIGLGPMKTGNEVSLTWTWATALKTAVR